MKCVILRSSYLPLPAPPLQSAPHPLPRKDSLVRLLTFVAPLVSPSLSFSFLESLVTLIPHARPCPRQHVVINHTHTHTPLSAHCAHTSKQALLLLLLLLLLLPSPFTLVILLVPLFRSASSSLRVLLSFLCACACSSASVPCFVARVDALACSERVLILFPSLCVCVLCLTCPTPLLTFYVTLLVPSLTRTHTLPFLFPLLGLFFPFIGFHCCSCFSLDLCKVLPAVFTVFFSRRIPLFLYMCRCVSL